MRPLKLKCEYAVDPLGVDVIQPRFSWELELDQRGQMQSAYQILVASCKEKLDVNVGGYLLTGAADEDIINGSRKTIPTRLMRTYIDTLIVTKVKVKDSPVDGLDSMAVKGEIAVEDINDSNLADVEVIIGFGSDSFTIPAGSFVLIKDNKYKCSKIDVTDGLVTALMDFDKCKFKVLVKNATLTTTTGTADFRVAFAAFDETDEATIP